MFPGELSYSKPNETYVTLRNLLLSLNHVISTYMFNIYNLNVRKNEWNEKAAAKENKFRHAEGKINFSN